MDVSYTHWYQKDENNKKKSFVTYTVNNVHRAKIKHKQMRIFV
jgi:hypothetical protein